MDRGEGGGGGGGGGVGAPLLPVCSEVTQVVHKERQPGSQVSYRTCHELKINKLTECCESKRQIK